MRLPPISRPLILTGVLLLAARLDASPAELAERVAARLTRLEQFTIDIDGTVGGGGASGMAAFGGGPKRVVGRMAIQDRGAGVAPVWKATLTLEVSLPFTGGAQRLPLIAVQRPDGLYLSLPLALPMGGGRQMAFRVPSSSGSGAGSANASAMTGGTRWLESALRQAGSTLTQDGNALHFQQLRPGNAAGPLEVRVEIDPQDFPSYLQVKEGYTTLLDMRIANLTEGPVDLTLPLPEESYEALPGAGSLGGSSPAVAASPSRPSRSPFASTPSNAASPAPQAQLPSGPAPAGGLAGLQQMFQGMTAQGNGGGIDLGGLQKMLQGMSAQGGGGGGMDLSGIQKMLQGMGNQGGGGGGLDLSGIQRMLQGMNSQGGGGAGGLDLSGLQKMLQGMQAPASGGSQAPGTNLAPLLQGLTGVLQGMSSGQAGGAGGGSPQSALQSLTETLERLRSSRQVAPSASEAPAPSPQAEPPRPMGLQGFSAGNSDAVQRLRERMRRLRSGHSQE